MTTVGYGDFFPKSYVGRLVGIIIAFWGTLFVSLFVVTLTNLLDFSHAEHKSFFLLNRLLDKDHLKKEAVNVLATAYLLKITRREHPEAKARGAKAMHNYRKYVLRFEKVARKIRSDYVTDTESDVVKREMEDLRAELELVQESMDKLNEKMNIYTRDEENIFTIIEKDEEGENPGDENKNT